MTICVFGDSVIHASYIKDSWVDLLRLCWEETIKESVEVYNLGVAGDFSSDILSRFEAETQARLPTKIIFAVGVNDSGYNYDTNQPLVDENTFKDNIQKLIDLSKKYTTDITFIGLVLGDDRLLKPFPGSFPLIYSYDVKRAKKYDGIIKSVAEKNSCSHIYLFDKLDFGDFMDGLHPNESGHRKMFEEIKKTIDKSSF